MVSFGEELMTVVEYSFHSSNDVSLMDESQMTRVYGVLLIDGFQPVVVCVGTGLRTRDGQSSLVGEDGVSRHSETTSQHQAFGEAGRSVKDYNIALFNGMSHQAAVGKDAISFYAEAVATTVYQQLVAVLIERRKSITVDAVYGKD